MKLRRLEVRALPGIEDPFVLDDLADGVNVLLGPNASGKSSVVRAVRALLYPEEARGAGVHLLATFDDGGLPLRCARIGDTVAWESDGRRVDPPPLPEHHEIGGYTLRIEDLVALDAGDRRIAAKLATELAGGFDLAKVRAALTEGPAGQKESKRYALASERLQAAGRARDALADQDARLLDLRAEAEGARAEAASAGAFDTGLALLEARGRLSAIETSLQEDFPPGLDAWTGDELRMLQEAEEGLREAGRERAEARAAARDARARVEASGVADLALGPDDVEAWQTAATALATLEREVRDAADRLAEAEGRVVALVREGGGRVPDHGRAADAPLAPDAQDRPAEPDVRPATIAELVRLLLERDEAEARAEAERAEAERVARDGEEPEDREPLRRSRAALMAWSVADERASARRGGAEAVLWPLAAILLAVTAAVTAATSAGGEPVAVAAPAPAALLCLTAIVAALGSVRAHRTAGELRHLAEARRAFDATGAPAPPAWTSEAVRGHLDALTRRLAEAEAAAERWARRSERLRDLEIRVERAETRARAAVQALRSACGDAGIDPRSLDLGLLDRLRWAHELRQARAARDSWAAVLERRSHAADEARRSSRKEMSLAGVDPGEDAATAEVLATRLGALARRVRLRDEARRDLDDARRREEGAERDAARHVARREALFRRCGLEEAGDEDPLAREAEARRRASLLPAWNERVSDRTGLRGEIRSLEASLAAHPGVLELVEEADEAALLDGRAAARTARERHDELLGEIARIETLVRKARAERDVEAARWEAREALDDLESALDGARAAEVGAFLMDRIEAEFRSSRQPAALERASAWFARFTHHAFSLRFDPAKGDAGAVHAHDEAAGRDRSSSELSTGTRAQLLLALRIGHAVESERGTRLPLFLDEALTTTDAERFGVVADALLTLAREDDRQVFYLSARRADADLWASLGPVATHDVAAARGRPWTTPVPDRYAVADAPVPDPSATSPQAFAVALGVRPVNPWAPAEVHPFHVLRDHLELVATLARLRVASLGALDRLLEDRAAAAAVLRGEERRLLRARSAGARAWCRAWCHGRARPLSEAKIALCEALTDRFRPEVSALCREVDGDAEALLERLDARAVGGFGPAKVEAFRAWLREEDLLPDPSPPPGPDPVVSIASALRDCGSEDAVREAERVARWLEAGSARHEDAAAG